MHVSKYYTYTQQVELGTYLIFYTNMHGLVCFALTECYHLLLLNKIYWFNTSMYLVLYAL